MLKRDSMIFESVRLLAVISVAICLIPAGAHFFELVNKMPFSQFTERRSFLADAIEHPAFKWRKRN